MEYIIRKATVDDAPSLCRLNREQMGYDYPAEATAERLAFVLANNTSAVFVAETNGETVGYVHADHYQVLYFEPMKNIMGIAVAAEHKRKGIGSALLRRVEEWAREEGCTAVRLVSGAARTAAHEFYRRCGYNGGKQQLNFRKSLL